MDPSPLASEADRFKLLDRLNVAELKALCKKLGIKGYSKAKRAELLSKLIQNQDAHPGGSIQSLEAQASQALSATRRQQQPLANVLSSSPTVHHLGDTISVTTSDALLVTPTGVPIHIHDQHTRRQDALSNLAVSLPQFPSNPTPSSFTLPFPPHLSLSIGLSPLASNPGSLLAPSSKTIGKRRREDTRNAAVSLKDVVTKQREAQETGLSELSSNEKGSKRVSIGAGLLNALKIIDEPSFHHVTTPSIAAGHVLGKGNRDLRSPLHVRSTSSRPNQSALTPGIRLATFPTFPINVADADKDNNEQYSLQRTGGVLTGNAAHAQSNVDTSLQARKDIQSAELQFSKERSTISTIRTKPAKSRNPKLAPVKKSVVPPLEPLQRIQVAPVGVAHLPLGSVPVASSSQMTAPRAIKPLRTQKKGPRGKFVAPAFKQASANPSSSKSVQPSLCQEETLLCGSSSSARNLQDRATARGEAISRIRKSWLHRFYQQVANARTDALNHNLNLASGSRSPIGLPGMAPEFVFDAATGPEELDAATIFVIARLHTQIHTNDWVAIIKDEQVIAVTKIGGGIWRVTTQTQVYEAARGEGFPTTAKAEKEKYLVIGDIGEVIGKGDADVSSLRQDWKGYLTDMNRDAPPPLIERVRTKDELAYPRGIAAGWSRSKVENETHYDEAYEAAEKYVLSNVMANRQV